MVEDQVADYSSFKWGPKKGVGDINQNLQFYESFVYGGVEYNLFDCVYLYSNRVDTDIGKLVEAYETPNHDKLIKLVWFYRPHDLRVYFKGYEPRWNEIFLASGEGPGLYNVNELAAIIAKCNVVCTSTDRRNPPASKEELYYADYIFCRNFNVDKLKIEESFPEKIGGIKVEYFFNKKRTQLNVNTPNSRVNDIKQSAKSDSQRLGFDKADGGVKDRNPSISVNPVVKESGGAVNKKGSELQPARPIGNSSAAKDFSRKSSSQTFRNIISGKSYTSRERSSEVGVQVQQLSDRQKEKVIASPNSKASISDRQKEKVIASPNSKTSISKRTAISSLPPKNLEIRSEQPPRHEGVVPGSASVVPFKKRKRHGDDEDESNRPDKLDTPSVQNRGTKTKTQEREDRASYFKPLPWEKRLQRALGLGLVLLLENLDPSYTSSEVEDLVQYALKMSVEAKMLQMTAFSNPYNGKALVLFKTKDAAESAMEELTKGCLMLGDGRPVICSRPNLEEPSKFAKFPGHLMLDHVRRKQKKEGELRDVASTCHSAQNNTIEWDMAMEWRAQQERSKLQWKALHEEQEREIQHLKRKLTKNYSGQQYRPGTSNRN